MTDKTIEWLHGVRAQDPEKPWFVYYSTGCAHAPHHVSKAWADKYQGRFDQGWDRYREETFARQKELGVIPADAVLTPRNEAFPAWDSVPAELKPFYARQMEVYAGFQENADWNVGRVLDAIEEMGELDNTLVIWIWGDNGASMEGTPTGSFNELTMQNGIPLTPEQQLQLAQQYGGLEAWGSDSMSPHCAAAWAWAGNCPFQWGKQVASHLGGTRNPMVVHWPARVHGPGRPADALHACDRRRSDDPRGRRHPAADPRRRDRAGADARRHFADSIGDAGAPERHTQQYFEIAGYRAMYKDGWWLAMTPGRIPWDLTPTTMKTARARRLGPGRRPGRALLPAGRLQPGAQPGRRSTRKRWRSCGSSSGRRPSSTRSLPLLGGLSFYFGIIPPLPTRSQVTYYGDVQNVASGMIPRIYNHSYTISADLEIPAGGAEGVIVAEADHLGGFSLFVEDGKLKHTYSMMGVSVYRQEAERPLPTGSVNVRLEFAADAPRPATGGQVTLFVNDEPVGGGRMDRTVPFRFSGYAGMDIGRDNGLPVERGYADWSPFAFTGTIQQGYLARPESKEMAVAERRCRGPPSAPPCCRSAAGPRGSRRPVRTGRPLRWHPQLRST